VKSTALFSSSSIAAAITLLVLSSAGVQAAQRPIRWNSGGAVWSTNQQAITTFLTTGEITDRGLVDGIHRSGWTADELRAGLTKPYSVELASVANFLYSDAGVKFLDNQTRSYFPYWTMKQDAVVALRASIIADAADGSISSAGILAGLPVDFRLAHTCNTYDGKQNVCDKGRCTTEAQCTSLFSWYVFLPACIQARQISTAYPSLGAPLASGQQRPVRALW
jgi:hypothetical protein